MENKIAWEKYPEGNKREEVFQATEYMPITWEKAWLYL